MMKANTHLIVGRVLQPIFKLTKIFFLIFYFIFIFTNESLANDEYLEYYQLNKKRIFDNIVEPLIYKEYIYSISIIEELDEVASIDKLKSKSELIAINNITKKYPKLLINWPASYSEKLIDELWKNFIKKKSIKINIDNRQYINIDNGFMDNKKSSKKYFYSVIVFKKEYLDSLYNISLNDVIRAL